MKCYMTVVKHARAYSPKYFNWLCIRETVNSGATLVADAQQLVATHKSILHMILPLRSRS